MSWHDHIEVNSAVLVGKPIVRGTRVAVEFVLELLAEGVTEHEVLDNYPNLTHDAVLACIAYATELVRDERAYPLNA